MFHVSFLSEYLVLHSQALSQIKGDVSFGNKIPNTLND